jgi:TetR/AcrR family transcriptional regulator, regulator of cefoperazone and chloramphenicol sensitivity
MDNDSVFLSTLPPIEPSSPDRIRDAAMKTFAAHGVAATSFRMVAETAGVSIGLVQHYFHNKPGLVAAVDEHVVRVIGQTLESEPLPAPPVDPFIEIGRRAIRLFRQQPDMINYIGRALVEGDRLGAVVFDGLLQVSVAQGKMLTERGLTRSDMDPLWGPLNPLLLRLSAILLRSHIERHLGGEPFTSTAQLQRWDKSVQQLIREGMAPPKPGDTGNGAAHT